MVIAITILSVLVAGMSLYLISAILHIGKIQKELESIAREQEMQNHDLRALIKAARDSAEAISGINEYLVEQSKKEMQKKLGVFGGPIGEA
jgi:ABC-type uncharacterized transport system fused permease/ATPase subunit